MPTKKKTAKKVIHKNTLLEKVSTTASHIKNDIIAGKDHLVEFAGEAFDSIRKGVKHLVETGKKTPKKKAVKKAAAKKIKKAIPKKSAKKVANKK